MTNKELEARIKELEEENGKLKAEDKEPKQPLFLPDPKVTPYVPYVEKEFVEVKLFKDDYRYKDALFVGINGKTWLIPRGVKVTLPKYVAEFIEQQMKDETRIWEKVEKEERDFADLTNKQV